jgi:PKD repeat protein
VITPPKVNSCFDNSTTNPVCADNYFCAYHSSYADGGSNPNVIYADLPTLLALNDPKGCQYDKAAYDLGNNYSSAKVQAPNGAVTKTADVTLKALSHEFNESITDPNGDAWWATASGQEDGDECNFYNPTPDPANDGNPNAFTPTLGGSQSAGTLYNQLINGHKYYIQSEWSNAGLDCEMHPTSKALTAAFTAPSATVKGSAVSFDPTGSSAAAGYSSATWKWGDGTADTFHNLVAAGTLAPQKHTFSALGSYTVTLTLVDRYGNLTLVSHAVTVKATVPAAAFGSSPSDPTATSPVSFDGSASTDQGGTLSSYSWDFGDGSAGTGKTTSHAYAKAGTYTVTLTVGDGTDTATVSHTVTVHGAPVASFAASSASAASGTAISFDGSGSSEANGSIASYAWSFGDGSSGTGASTSHAYSKAGTYTVTLTVTDGFGATASTTRQVTVTGVPKAEIAIVEGRVIAGVPFAFDGSQSSDSGSTIASYSWSFGDGGTATGKSVSHTFGKTGTFPVILTVTDASGTTASITERMTVKAPSITKVKVRTGKKREQLKVSVSGPGTLKLGSKKTKIKAAKTVTLTVKLSRSQRHTLRSKGKLTVRYKLSFSPISGGQTSRKVTVKVKK